MNKVHSYSKFVRTRPNLVETLVPYMQQKACAKGGNDGRTRETADGRWK